MNYFSKFFLKKMFLQNLLRKIKELLLTLAKHEVIVLEMLLCQQEEPANITNKLKEVRFTFKRVHFVIVV